MRMESALNAKINKSAFQKFGFKKIIINNLRLLPFGAKRLTQHQGSGSHSELPLP